ncbi:MAG: hypothetical protein FJZ56_03790, partial [Chlamydiae bacterium]|nr:hypothetical protein [Chlamydiota bacterium]
MKKAAIFLICTSLVLFSGFYLISDKEDPIVYNSSYTRCSYVRESLPSSYQILYDQLGESQKDLVDEAYKSAPLDSQTDQAIITIDIIMKSQVRRSLPNDKYREIYDNLSINDQNQIDQIYKQTPKNQRNRQVKKALDKLSSKSSTQAQNKESSPSNVTPTEEDLLEQKEKSDESASRQKFNKLGRKKQNTTDSSTSSNSASSSGSNKNSSQSNNGPSSDRSNRNSSQSNNGP